MKSTMFGLVLGSVVLAGTFTAMAADVGTSQSNFVAATNVVSVDGAIRAQPVAYSYYGWRYRWYGNRWWYWTPNNNWVYWYGNAWVPYGGGVAVYNYGYPYRYSTGYRGPYYRPYPNYYYGPRYGYGYGYGRRGRWW